MSKLKSSFTDINIEEVKTFLKKTGPITMRKSAPELWFYDENEIEPGCYDFEIDGLHFKRCWIEPFDKEEGGPIRYRSSSYYVIQF
jgi:hypothetical protein